MEAKKYKLTDETIEFDGNILHRIKALKNFSNVHEGDLGGWIEKEENLSHNGDCWVYGDAMVYEKSFVHGNARIYGQAEIFNNAEVYGNACIFDNVCLYGHSKVFENARIWGNVHVRDRAKVYGCPRISENAFIHEDAIINGPVVIESHTTIGGNAEVSELGDYITFQTNWSFCDYFTWTKSNNMWHTDTFNGTGKEFIKHECKQSKERGKKYEAYVQFVEQFNKI